MAKATIMDDKVKPAHLNDVLLQVLVDTAKKEIGKGINVKFLAEIYSKTYGRSITRKIFKILKQIKTG